MYVAFFYAKYDGGDFTELHSIKKPPRRYCQDGFVELGMG